MNETSSRLHWIVSPPHKPTRRSIWPNSNKIVRRLFWCSARHIFQHQWENQSALIDYDQWQTDFDTFLKVDLVVTFSLLMGYLWGLAEKERFVPLTKTSRLARDGSHWSDPGGEVDREGEQKLRITTLLFRCSWHLFWVNCFHNINLSVPAATLVLSGNKSLVFCSNPFMLLTGTPVADSAKISQRVDGPSHWYISPFIPADNLKKFPMIAKVPKPQALTVQYDMPLQHWNQPRWSCLLFSFWNWNALSALTHEHAAFVTLARALWLVASNLRRRSIRCHKTGLETISVSCDHWNRNWGDMNGNIPRTGLVSHIRYLAKSSCEPDIGRQSNFSRQPSAVREGSIVNSETRPQISTQNTGSQLLGFGHILMLTELVLVCWIHFPSDAEASLNAEPTERLLFCGGCSDKYAFVFAATK